MYEGFAQLNCTWVKAGHGDVKQHARLAAGLDPLAFRLLIAWYGLWSLLADRPNLHRPYGR
jgi:hypothetical protein